MASDSSTEELDIADQPPFNSSFEIQGNFVVEQTRLISECISGMSPNKYGESLADLKNSLPAVQNTVKEYLEMVKQREEWWKARLKREQERQDVWEQSLQAVVREGEALEKELKTRFRRRSRLYSTSTPREGGTLKARLSGLPIVASPIPSPNGYFGSPEPIPDDSTVEKELVDGASPFPQRLVGEMTTSTAVPTARNLSLMFQVGSPGAICGDAETVVDTDEEDEFFDAIETNNLPNLIISQALTRHDERLYYLDKQQYGAYTNFRTCLAITSDDRPPTSLWSILKNSIGKDLTKISFPVFFNEPTSMLQRMAEDMEFPQCLDAACHERDPFKRIAFVAAFAMSNYSSTIGRIAKPFNPMLGETFEYVDLAQEYRYISEQVSHHPPISACWAESPGWRYYGEVDAQNKFMGKSFEIRPTGVAHAELILDQSWAPGYPKDKHSRNEGKVVEHYSWKKVTTNVSGFILGAPTIDHYGDMVVKNHRTGDQCALTFKPRGWRGRDAFEISGYVSDSRGKVMYEIAGRWNSQLVARAVGTGVGLMHPDVSTSQSPEYILLWRNSEKPPAPFNLTPFAITLNDCPEDTLKPFLCPTDCRLRPDQRAFELGKYERANELKQRQEEKQRATRRAREEGRLEPHRPRWFTAETELDTGERVWTPSRIGEELEYWIERESVWKAMVNGNCDGKQWKQVESIFIDDEP